MQMCDRCNQPTDKQELEDSGGLCKPCKMLDGLNELERETARSQELSAIVTELFGEKAVPRATVHRQFQEDQSDVAFD